MRASTVLPPITAHFIIFLDLDKTLVYSRTYNFAELITYNGDYNTWRDALTRFRDYALTEGIMIHYGIATLRKRKTMENPELIGDVIYGQIMGDPSWRLFTKCSYANDLSKLIDSNLVFFLGETLEQLSNNVTDAHKQALTEGSKTDYPSAVCVGDKYYLLHEFYQCKAINALEVGRQYIQKKYNILVPRQQVILIDNSPNICLSTMQRGFNSICVHHLQDAEKALQVRIIKLIFEELLVNQLSEVHSPKAVSVTLEEANKAILTILNPTTVAPAAVAEARELISDLTLLPGQPSDAELKFFKPKSAEQKDEKLTQNDAKPDGDKSFQPSSGFNYGS
jgi:hypothetical protein